MTPMSLSQIKEAIQVLESSFTYDPPERWRGAYEQLQDVRAELRNVRKPYAWIHWLAWAIMIGGVLIGLGAILAVPSHMALWVMLALLVLPIPESSSWLVDALARRKHPALRYQSEIESVCRPFDDLAADTRVVTAA